MTMANRKIILTFVIMGTLLAAGGASLADGPDNRIASFASNSITPFLVIGELSLLANNKQEAVQGAKALVCTCLITQALKIAVKEKRPNSESTTSFPSGHTSAAFAMASIIADYKPKYKQLAYGSAALIGWSRVETGSHHTHDVVAGAIIGYVTARHFTSKHIMPTDNGIILAWQF